MTTPDSDSSALLPAVLNAQALTELGLTEQDMVRVEEATKALQDLSPGNLHTYGSDAAAKTNALSTQLLEKVRNADLDGSGDKLGEVVRIARSLNLDAFDQRSSVPILGPLINRFKQAKGELIQKYSSTNQQMDQLMRDVAQTQATQQQRVREYDQMHAVVLEERRELGVHAAAGRLRMAQLQQEMNGLMGREDPQSRTRRGELDTALRLIEKRVSDLQVLQHVADQTLPMIRLIQANAIQLIEKFSAVRDVTLPMWRNQFAIQLSLSDQRNAANLANAIDDASNELMRRNAELMQQTATETARVNQRSMLDIETLRHVHDKLIQTVEEVRDIHREGIAKRQQMGQELVHMREELNQRLAVPTRQPSA